MKRIVPVIVMLSALIVVGSIVRMLKEPAQVIEKQIDKAKYHNADLEKGVEEILNNFLNEIASNARAYKKQRKILVDLTKPVNLRNTEYITENYKMMLALLPDLQAQMDSIMLAFEEADNKVNVLVQDQSEDTRKTVLANWEYIKTQKAGIYVEFFTVEQEILQAYKDLMKFYYKKQNVLTVNLEIDKVTFTEIEDTQQEQEMLRIISDLSKKQAALLQKR